MKLGLQNKNIDVPTHQLEEDGPAVVDQEHCEYNLAHHDVGRL